MSNQSIRAEISKRILESGQRFIASNDALSEYGCVFNVGAIQMIVPPGGMLIINVEADGRYRVFTLYDWPVPDDASP